MNRLKYSFFICVPMCILLACGGSNLSAPEPGGEEEKAKTLTESGWVQYEIGEYNNAIQLFNDAKKADSEYLDAYNGLGWSYFRVHNLILSLFNFRVPLAVDSTMINVLVGYSIASFEKNEYSEAVDAVLKVVSQDSSRFDLEGTDEYFFIHDTDVTSRQIRKILALSYFYSGNFMDSYYQLLNFLDPLTRVDPSSETFYKDLLEALEKI